MDRQCGQVINTYNIGEVIKNGASERTQALITFNQYIHAQTKYPGEVQRETEPKARGKLETTSRLE